MRIFTRFLSILMVLLSILLFISQARSQVANLPRLSSTSFPRVNEVITSPPRYSSESPDSCNLKIYIEDDSIANDAFNLPLDENSDIILLGNYFPIDSGTSGIIKSVYLSFSSYGNSGAISSVVYFYKADQKTIFGQSANFMSYGATWPDGTWDTVLCPDIPYTGPFYAMYDCNPNYGNYEPNFFDIDSSTYTPQYPYGYGYDVFDGTWCPAIQCGIYEGADPHATFLERVYVCEPVVVGIKKLTPESISIYPNPAIDKITIKIEEDQAPSQLSIMNLNGKEVLTSSLIKPKTQIDINNLPSGVYFVRLTSDRTVEVGKIVKQ